jgi:CRISPR-associated protein Cas1
MYVTHEKCYVRAEGGHLRLTRHGETLGTIPLIGLKTIVILDNVNLSAAALDLLLANGIDIIYMSKWGKVKSRVLSAKGGGAVLRLAQCSVFFDLEKRLGIAKSIVAAKIENQLSVVRKYKYHDTSGEFDNNIAAISGFASVLGKAAAIDEIMGLEGIAAKHYWECFRRLLKKPVFTRREYRPSPDYVNALLNLGYAFLSNEIAACLTALKFDIEIGFLHSIHYGRNSLVLDSMEEFRAPFIDAWALSLLNKSQLGDAHFHIVDGDWRMTDDGFRKFCGLFHERVPLWRGRFREQASTLKASLLKGAGYEPYRQ